MSLATGYVAGLLLVTAGVFVAADFVRDTHRKILYSTLCSYSKYNTEDFMYQNKVLYCRASPASYQRLHKAVKKKISKRVM